MGSPIYEIRMVQTYILLAPNTLRKIDTGFMFLPKSFEHEF